MMRLSKTAKRGLLAFAVMGLILAVLGLNMAGRYSGLTIPKEAPEAIAELLAPHITETRPEGDGPFPTALLFSGCDGVHDNMLTWAERLKSDGWASLIVDSHTPRGFTDLQIWRLICAGQLLTGAERAGDVAAALAMARQKPYVDENAIALIGASHGGWAVLEFLSGADHDEIPLTLDSWPEEFANDPLHGVKATLLLYPYCGDLSRAARRGWSNSMAVLFLLVEDDSVTDEEDCVALAEREARKGLPIETTVYGGVTHGFDQQDKSPLSPLTYDPETTEAAMTRALAFLNSSVGR